MTKSSRRAKLLGGLKSQLCFYFDPRDLSPCHESMGIGLFLYRRTATSDCLVHLDLELCYAYQVHGL
jgi:hypothetical protein